MKGFSIAGLALGAVGAVCGVLGLVFSLLGLRRSRRWR